MQTILGAGGPVSNALSSLLAAGGGPVRLLSRKPVAATGNVSWQGADLKDYDSLLQAAKGSETLYMCAGLRYDKRVWQEEWPLIMTNLIRLATETGARLLFFDNVYMYGRVKGPMTEDSPVKPESVKGAVRAGVADQLMNAIAKGTIRGSIARAADFYGSVTNSFFDMMVLRPLLAGKSAQWLGNAKSLHSFTYVPDAARGMALLGARPDSDGRIWHLPTAPAMTGEAFIQLAAEICGAKPKHLTINQLMLRLMGLFNKTVGETAEMYYQYRYDYQFDSSRFEQAFGAAATPYAQGIAEAVAR